MNDQQDARGATPRGRASSRLRTWLIGGLTAVIVVMLLVHAFLFETFTVPSPSMEPALWPGDRIVVQKQAGPLHRGDIIVFSGEDSMYEAEPATGLRGVVDTAAGWLGFRPGETDFVKRIIGVGGDAVSVDAKGVLRVNGRVVHEPYLRADKASSDPFSVKVPAGKLFVMGDNRDNSDDSRNHLGKPGGGMVPTDRVVGKVTWTYWNAR